MPSASRAQSQRLEARQAARRHERVSAGHVGQKFDDHAAVVNRRAVASEQAGHFAERVLLPQRVVLVERGWRAPRVTRSLKPSTSTAMRTLRPNGEVNVERSTNFSGSGGHGRPSYDGSWGRRVRICAKKAQGPMASDGPGAWGAIEMAINDDALRLLVLEGDGIGPEITAATLAVLRAADAKFGPSACASRRRRSAGRRTAPPAPPFPIRSRVAAKAANGVLLGPVSHNDYPPRAQGGLNPSGELRKRLDALCQYKAGALARGFSAALRQRRRSGDRAREHRRFLRRPQHVSRLRRIHADARSGDRHAQDHARRFDPHRGGRLQARAAAA